GAMVSAFHPPLELRMRTIAFSVLIFGCTGTSGKPLPLGSRIVVGRLVPPTASELGTDQGTPAVQLVGAHDSHTLFFGDPFDITLQSGGANTVPFRLQLPCDQTVSLHFQFVGNSSANQLGHVIALIQFPQDASGKTTPLLPFKRDCVSDPGREINLGTI